MIISYKLSEDKKKPKFTITIDEKLDEILTEHLEENEINRSKYIENLIRKDFEERGLNIKPDFEK